MVSYTTERKCSLSRYAVDVDQELLDKWNQFMSLRDDVNRALEAARNEKVIGKSLEAKVVTNVTLKLQNFYNNLMTYNNYLSSLK